jgi:fatty acid synthase subunit alpha, fungi type
MPDNITSMLINKLIECKYGGNKNKILTIDYLSAMPAPVLLPTGIKAKKEENAIAFTVGATVPLTEVWVEALVGPKLLWLQAFLTSRIIIQDMSYLNNPIHCLFMPCVGQKVVVQLSDAAPVGVKLYSPTHLHSVQAMLARPSRSRGMSTPRTCRC